MLMLLLALHTPIRPTPVAPRQYHLINKVTVEMAMMPAPIMLTQSAFVSISTTDSAAGQIVTITIDSSSFDAGAMTANLQAQMGADPKGVVLRAYVVNGRIASSIDPSMANLQAMQLVPAIQLLLAGTRASKPGDSWVDSTIADTSAASAGMTKAAVITSWKVSDGAAGAMQFDGDVTGTMTISAMQMDIQTTGSSHVTARPRELPTMATSQTTGQGNMNMGGQALTMKVSTDVSATLVP
jgi:hypothetical protein